jgi:hypothetical protein
MGRRMRSDPSCPHGDRGLDHLDYRDRDRGPGHVHDPDDRSSGNTQPIDEIDWPITRMVLVTVRTCSDQLAGSGYGQWPLPMIQELIVGPFRQCAFT